MEEKDVYDIVNSEHQKQALYCEDRFLPAKKTLWVSLVVLGTIVGAALASFIPLSNTVAGNSVKIDRNTQAIESIHATMFAVDTCVYLLKQLKQMRSSK